MATTNSTPSGDAGSAGYDELELEAAGYKAAMPRQFSFWSLGALSFTLTCTWLGVGSSIGISLSEASAGGTVWSLPIAGFMTLIVASGMAELASVSLTQLYHLSSISASTAVMTSDCGSGAQVEADVVPTKTYGVALIQKPKLTRRYRHILWLARSTTGPSWFPANHTSLSHPFCKCEQR